MFLVVASLSATPVKAAKEIDRLVVLGDSLSDDGGDNSTWFLLKTLNGQTGWRGINHMRPWVHSWLEERVWSYSWWCRRSWANCPAVENKLLSTMISITRSTGAVPVTPPDYYDRGRWSNSKVWAEYLAPMLGLSVRDSNEYRNLSHAGGWSLCVGDKSLGFFDLTGSPKTVAMNMVNGSLIPPCLKLLAKGYLYKHGRFDKGDLVIVFFGGNDYLNLYQDPWRVVDAQREVVEMAIKNGAGAVAWLNMPDIANAPRYQTGGKRADADEASNLISKHNDYIWQQYQGLKRKYRNKGTDIIHIDAKGIYDEILRESYELGFMVTDQPCNTLPTPGLDDGEQFDMNPSLNAANEAAQSGGGICENPDEYMFWDGVHPTSATHEVIASKACEKLQALGYSCTL